MAIQIRYFAILRERLGLEGESIELSQLPQSPTVADVFKLCIASRNPELGRARSHMRAALNMDFVDYESTVQDGDEIAFIPPVSGGLGVLSSAGGRFALTTDPIVPQNVSALVERPDAGALCTFEGVVRNHTGDRQVDHLEYDAYPQMALKKIEETAQAAEQKWPGTLAAVHHRWGRLEIGEAAVVIAVSSPHRAEAFEACRWIIDTLKAVVPIWKKEVSPDGEEWVGWGP